MPLAGLEDFTTDTTGFSGCVVLQVVQSGGLLPSPPEATTLLPTVPVASLFTVAV